MPGKKFKEIKWLRITGRFEYDNGVPDGAVEALEELFRSEKLMKRKRRKRARLILTSCMYKKHTV